MLTGKHITVKRQFSALALAVCLCLAIGPLAMAQDDEVSDKDVTRAINSELWADDQVSANQIGVSTSKGIVTLDGTVDSILAKDRAREISEAIVGVRAIVDKITVEPKKPQDDKDLAQAVKNAWLMDPATDSYELSVTASDGFVTISGTVDSYAEKTLSEDVAKSVRGVTGVRNEIKVNYKRNRPDMEIQNEIEARLMNDIRVDDYLIDVKVKNGKAKLSGTVGSQQEKTRAYVDSWVAGVNSVSTDDLEVKWWARDEMRRKSTFLSRTDEQIKKAVNDAFTYDPRVWSFNIDVDVSDGTVTLNGIVDNLAAKRAAENDARNTLGVWRVTNQLKVRAEIPPNDELEKRVGSALFNDPYVERFDITVNAYDGWVYLSGTVNTSFEKYQAEDVATKVNGVVGVVNNLDYDYYWVWRLDREIKADVEDQLQWSTFIDESDINVAVDDGVVTLTGVVDSWSEKQDAEKNAFQGGAKDVENNLDVSYAYYGPNGPDYYGNPGYQGNPGYYTYPYQY